MGREQSLSGLTTPFTLPTSARIHPKHLIRIIIGRAAASCITHSPNINNPSMKHFTRSTSINYSTNLCGAHPTNDLNTYYQSPLPYCLLPNRPIPITQIFLSTLFRTGQGHPFTIHHSQFPLFRAKLTQRALRGSSCSAETLGSHLTRLRA